MSAAAGAVASGALVGSSAEELVRSLTAWCRTRVGNCGGALWVRAEDGARLLASAGSIDLGAAAELLPDVEASAGVVGRRPFLGLPLSCGGVRIGSLLLVLHEGTAAEMAPELERIVLQLAQRLPTAIELDRLQRALAQLAEAERLQRALYAIAELASSGRETREMLAAIHGVVGGLMYAENFFIALYEAASATLSFPYFRDVADDDAPAPGKQIPLDAYAGSLTAWVILHGRTLMGPSADLVRQFVTETGTFGPQSVAWLGVPLRRDGEVIGAVVVQSYDERHVFSEKENALLTFVAQHIATALERRQAREELERRVAQRTEELYAANRALQAEVEERQRGEKLQAALFRIAELGSTGGGLDDFYAAVHAVVAELLYAGNFYIALLAADGGSISFPYSVDEHDPERKPRRLGRGMTEYVLRSGRPLLADRVCIAALAERGEVASSGARSTEWLGVPLICSEKTVGVLAVQSYDDAHSYSRRDQELLTFVSYHIANALERKQASETLRSAYGELERRVEQRTEALFEANRDLRQQITVRERIEWQFKHAALHDALTGLPNRSLLLERMGESLARYAARRSSLFAVLFLDLDRFKVVNDSVGHLIGDELLKEAASRIAASVGKRGLVARLGGDEFAVLLDPVEGEDEVREVAAAIIESMEDPIRAGGKELYSSTSIGIALAHPHYRSPAELLRDADVALYRAKARGRRRYELFDETLRREALHQLELEGNLRRAIARGEFEPVFQPIYNLTSRQVVGYEALLRWRHPQRGLLLPGDFLTQAEDSGLAEAIDWLVYELVFAQAHPLLDAGRYVSINVGGRHFRSLQFVPSLLALVARYGLEPQQLRIEVTERTLLEEPTLVRELLDQMGAAGLRVALDDFGTGYSSLSYLHQFPLHSLKVDQSFVNALTDAAPGNAVAVLRAICTLGQSLDMEVIAEGIETTEQLDKVRELGCDFGQGFLLAMPQSARALLAGAQPDVVLVD